MSEQNPPHVDAALDRFYRGVPTPGKHERAELAPSQESDERASSDTSHVTFGFRVVLIGLAVAWLLVWVTAVIVRSVLS